MAAGVGDSELHEMVRLLESGLWLVCPARWDGYLDLLCAAKRFFDDDIHVAESAFTGRRSWQVRFWWDIHKVPQRDPILKIIFPRQVIGQDCSLNESKSYLLSRVWPHPFTGTGNHELFVCIHARK